MLWDREGHARNEVFKAETYNAVWDLSRHMHEATKDHYKDMLPVLKYSVDTSDQGLVLKPNREWDGSQKHEFIISGCLDSDYVKEPKDSHSVSGNMVYLKGAPEMFKSSTERTVTIHYRGRDICRTYLCARHALYEKCPRATKTQGQALCGPGDGQPRSIVFSQQLEC